jgi:competence protein ComEC
MTIIYLGLCWFAGLWLASRLEPDLSFWLLGAAGMGLTAVFTRHTPGARLWLLGAAVLCLGGARYVAGLPDIGPEHIAHYNDQDNVLIIGLVTAEPDVRDNGVNLRVQAEQIVLADGRIHAVTGLILVQTPRYPVIEYGTRLRLNGRLQTPFATPEFSYRDYLARHNIYSGMSWPLLTIVETGQGQPLRTALLRFKGATAASIERNLPDPQSGLLNAVLLGLRRNLSPAIVNDFRATGLSHLIVVSGFHVSILVGALAAVTTPLVGRQRAVWPAMVVLVLYTLLVGAGPSVVRAAVMGGVYLVSARLFGRPTFAPASLFAAGLGMTLWRPDILWEVGFQLSFTATLGIMLYAGWWRQIIARWLWRRLSPDLAQPLMQWVVDILLISLAAQILTLPLIAVYFGQISLVSLPANLLVASLQPAALIVGGLAALAGLISPLLGQALGWLAWLPLTATLVIARALAAIPGVVAPVTMGWGGLTAVYALIFALTWLAWRPTPAGEDWRERFNGALLRPIAVWGGAIAVILTLAWNGAQPDGRLHVAFLDVGHGDAIFVQTPSGRRILIDGGQYPTALREQVGRQMPFWAREIDLLILSTPGDEQIGGLPELFGRYRIGQMVVDGPVGDSPAHQALFAAAQQAGTPIHYGLAGETILIEDGVRLEILHPGGTAVGGHRRENSLVIRLVYGDFSLLLTGSVTEAGERALLERSRPLTALVYRAGRQGANDSGSAALLTAVQPQIIIITAGAENRFGRPHPEMLARAAAVNAVVLRTDELGGLKLVTDGRQMHWQAQR